MGNLVIFTKCVQILPNIYNMNNMHVLQRHHTLSFSTVPTVINAHLLPFGCMPFTSYRVFQTQPLASYALAIRIIFPSVGVIQASFCRTGLPASRGKQKSVVEYDAFFYFNGLLFNGLL
ncbi:hypothetical protein D8T51_02975 [Vibrio vulnificus]|nr:hypothetical protein D8T52_05125 [Vibrio vulnificus]RZP83504.1 hypothetical protein D8T51_02975 [Vibrio vulnificus]RZP89571.1 hypothetical protein D8T62_10545 [Vibrio vulnificus]RZP93920.1 hypothetical protein D8T56_00515 [Vibrio vulnificus]RZQ10791.1 hypothetical protein D8T39_10290 [Vibrio vulnificus]